MAHFSRELELKLSGTPSDIAAVRKSVVFTAGHGGIWRRLTSTYYDTADGRLARAGFSLRLRPQNGGYAKTVKRLSPAAGAMERLEYQAQVENTHHVIAPIGDESFDGLVRDAEDGLQPVARVWVDRWSQIITHPGGVVEAAIDLGEAQKLKQGEVAAVAPVAEIEFELLKGDPTIIFDLARETIKDSKGRIRPSVTTKLERAMSADMPSIGKTPKVSLDTEMGAGDALAIGLSTLGRRIASLTSAVVDARNAEASWQMRVALRRLRALEKVFRRGANSNSLRDLAARARIYAKLIGAARDWDVFIDGTLPNAAARDRSFPINGRSRRADRNMTGFQLLKEQAEAERAETADAAISSISAPAFSLFILDILEAAYLQPWRASARSTLNLPAETFAAAALEKRLQAAIITARAIDPEEPETLHALRLDIKKLRYTAQFFRNLYPKEIRKPYFLAMAALQEKLGTLNDAVVAQGLAEEASAGQGALAARSAGFICGLKSAEAERATDDIQIDWRSFLEVHAYWRPLPLSDTASERALGDQAGPDLQDHGAGDYSLDKFDDKALDVATQSSLDKDQEPDRF